MLSTDYTALWYSCVDLCNPWGTYKILNHYLQQGPPHPAHNQYGYSDDEVWQEKYQGPLLLTWFNFNPSIDK